jgi:hypothetical protein
MPRLLKQEKPRRQQQYWLWVLFVAQLAMVPALYYLLFHFALGFSYRLGDGDGVGDMEFCGDVLPTYVPTVDETFVAVVSDSPFKGPEPYHTNRHGGTQKHTTFEHTATLFAIHTNRRRLLVVTTAGMSTRCIGCHSSLWVWWLRSSARRDPACWASRRTLRRPPLTGRASTRGEHPKRKGLFEGINRLVGTHAAM